MTWYGPWVRPAAAMVAAVALTGAAAFTVEQAGCDDPGVWVFRNGSVELVGGCVDREDLPVAPAPGPWRPAPVAPAGD